MGTPKMPSNENTTIQKVRNPNKVMIVSANDTVVTYNGNNPSMRRLRFGSSMKSIRFFIVRVSTIFF